MNRPRVEDYLRGIGRQRGVRPGKWHAFSTRAALSVSLSFLCVYRPLALPSGLCVYRSLALPSGLCLSRPLSLPLSRSRGSFVPAQELDSILVGPVPLGQSEFTFAVRTARFMSQKWHSHVAGKANAPDPSKIPPADLVGVTVVLITCSYKVSEQSLPSCTHEYPRFPLLRRNVSLFGWDTTSSAITSVRN
jgi:hypothetical protein